MINKWILNNFKSINKEKELEFRPLTIFTGANSSGKSTILQSILLVTQTLQNQIPSKSIVLNGWFKKFGNYGDIVYGREFERNIKIGFSISNMEEDEDLYWRRIQMMRRHVNRMMLPPEVCERELTTTCEFEVSSAGDENNLQPEMENVKFGVSCEGVPYGTTIVTKWGERTEVEQKVYDAIREKNGGSELNYTIQLPSHLPRRYADEESLWKPIGVGFDHFLPNMMVGYCNNREQIKVYLRNYLLMGSSYYYDVQEYEKQIIPLIWEKSMDIVEQLYKKGSPIKNIDKQYDDIHKKFTLKRLQKMLSSCALDEEKHKYVSQIVDKLNGLPEEYRVEPKPLHHLSGIHEIREFFNDRIKYLGPLREEPKSLYPLSSEGATNEVGLKGENTAAVYDTHQNDVIRYVDPASFKNPENSNLKERRGTLAEAVNKWLVYMGVASDVVTDDEGKRGHTMQISNDIAIKQDLTNVGVGVSQVMPILVMSLLAKKGDVIILEQPELHLHPKVQTRLADFFVSMNALDKQCVLETHSEYLINRLRYLVAVNDNNTIADSTMIYFVEKENGYSKYRPVTINRYGVVEEWPKGFFDESENIAAQILRAGMEKRMREEGDDEDDE